MRYLFNAAIYPNIFLPIFSSPIDNDFRGYPKRNGQCIFWDVCISPCAMSNYGQQSGHPWWSGCMMLMRYALNEWDCHREFSFLLRQKSNGDTRLHDWQHSYKHESIQTPNHQLELISPCILGYVIKSPTDHTVNTHIYISGRCFEFQTTTIFTHDHRSCLRFRWFDRWSPRHWMRVLERYSEIGG